MTLFSAPQLNTCTAYVYTSTRLPILIHALVFFIHAIPILIHWLGLRLLAPNLNTLIHWTDTTRGCSQSELSTPEPSTLGNQHKSNSREPSALGSQSEWNTREPSALGSQSESSITSPESSANQNRVLRHPSRQPIRIEYYV